MDMALDAHASPDASPHASPHASPDQSPNQSLDSSLDSSLDYFNQTEKARVLLTQNPLYRHALYAILRACSEEDWQLDELEAYILTLDEYGNTSQPPYTLIQWLDDALVLDTWEIDAHGEKLTPERCVDLTEDEIDDLAVSTVFRANSAGMMILDEFSPKARLMELFYASPLRVDTYLEVLEFLREKRLYADLDQLLRGREVLMDGRGDDEGPMQPSVYVDKLSSAGGIVYREGWIITREGKEFLETYKAQ